MSKHMNYCMKPATRSFQQRRPMLVIGVWLVVVGAAVLIAVLVGCTPTQEATAAADLRKAAADGNAAKTMLVGSPTTQPSLLVSGVEAIVPASTPYINLAGVLLGVVSAGLGVAGTYLASKPKAATLAATASSLAASVTDHKAAIAEVLGDVKSWTNPTVPFTTKTQQIVSDVAGIVAAAPTSGVAALTGLTVSPAVAPEPPASAVSA